MDDESPVRRQLELFAAQGIQIALDGPLTASATLELLRAYPIHRLIVDPGDDDAAEWSPRSGRCWAPGWSGTATATAGR